MILGLLSHAGLVSLSRFIGTGLIVVFGALCIRGTVACSLEMMKFSWGVVLSPLSELTVQPLCCAVIN